MLLIGKIQFFTVGTMCVVFVYVATERLDMIRRFVDYGLEHWGSDQQGVNRTRRFLLEWLSFLHRYVPAALCERQQKVVV